MQTKYQKIFLSNKMIVHELRNSIGYRSPINQEGIIWISKKAIWGSLYQGYKCLQIEPNRNYRSYIYTKNNNKFSKEYLEISGKDLFLLWNKLKEASVQNYQYQLSRVINKSIDSEMQSKKH